MISEEKLFSFYVKQYKKASKRKVANMNKKLRGYDMQVKRLSKSLCHIKKGKISIGQLAYMHHQVNFLYTLAVKINNQKYISIIENEHIRYLMDLDLSILSREEKNEIDEQFIEYVSENMSKMICDKTLWEVLFLYRDYFIRKKVSELVPLRPEMEFPEVLEMKRKFILHVGATNSGKTYHALERLKDAKTGVYLGPLRLLALEVYEKMKEYGTPCTMLTGQERIVEQDSHVTASTIEMLDIEQFYDIGVIDEAQMIIDSDRGHSWTRAILGMRAREIHICMSPAAKEVITHLITLCHDTYEIHEYERKTPLICETTPFRFPEDVKQGDALIVFSKKAVLDVAGRLEAEGISSSVIYGSLPPEIRRRQMHLFNQGKNKVVVSTDAIGMGLNLPVRRIVFIETDKFDGTKRRKLMTSEIKQIAGRAGRFGLYDTGYISALGEEALAYIREMAFQTEQQIDKVSLGFPQVLLNLPEPLDVIMNTWHQVETEYPFEKISIDEILFLYHKAEKQSAYIDGFQDKHVLYKMVTCPIDIQNPKVVSLWLRYCETYSADVSLRKPDIRQLRFEGIAKYETYYKELDLYYQFSERFGKIIDEKWLADEREKTEVEIMKCLSKGKENYIATCRYCGKILPVGYSYNQCRQCRSMVYYE